MCPRNRKSACQSKILYFSTANCQKSDVRDEIAKLPEMFKILEARSITDEANRLDGLDGQIRGREWRDWVRTAKYIGVGQFIENSARACAL
jgi:hypothetical protein